MAISLRQYLAESGARDQLTRDNIETCVDCGTLLQETISGHRPTKDGAKCSDCYFDDLSKLIDEHPIGRPIAARGSAD